jgi:hypothetical protein
VSYKITGYIILRDIPKQAVQLDLSIYQIRGGFRGFALVLPGIHYISVQDKGEMIEGFWCYLESLGAIIKVYDYEQKKFIAPDQESENRYKIMALSGAMNKALIPVIQRNPKQTLRWQKLTSFLKAEHLNSDLHNEIPMKPPINITPEELNEWYLTKNKSRFELTLLDSHKGNINSLLAEFQLMFIKWLIKKNDEVAFNRWFHLLNAFYNAGETSINSFPNLFSNLADILVEQFNCFPKKLLQNNNRLFKGLSYMIEDMDDTGNLELKKKSQKLKALLKNNLLTL